MDGYQSTEIFGRFLQEHGYTALAIRSPTIPEGQERLRIVLHAHNTPEEVVSMLALLEEHVAAGVASQPASR